MSLNFNNNECNFTLSINLNIMKIRVSLLAIMLFLFSCEKPAEEKPVTTGTVTFWTTELNGWVLYVDDVKIGPVRKPYPIGNTDEIPVCGDGRFTNLQLNPGRHQYYISIYISTQLPPNYFRGQTRFFDVTLGGCVILRAEQ